MFSPASTFENTVLQVIYLRRRVFFIFCHVNARWEKKILSSKKCHFQYTVPYLIISLTACSKLLRKKFIF